MRLSKTTHCLGIGRRTCELRRNRLVAIRGKENIRRPKRTVLTGYTRKEIATPLSHCYYRFLQRLRAERKCFDTDRPNVL